MVVCARIDWGARRYICAGRSHDDGVLAVGVVGVDTTSGAKSVAPAKSPTTSATINDETKAVTGRSFTASRNE
jgi:hypothetical protein